MARAAELVEAARALVAAGRWERADALLSAHRDDPAAAYALAEAAVDAALWRHGSARGAAHDRAAERLVAAAGERSGTLDVATRLLALRHRYQRLFFSPPDRRAAIDLRDDLAAVATQTCADCEPTAGWNAFYLGLCHDHLLGEPDRAAPLYAEAKAHARQRGDRLAESYPLRHLAVLAEAEGRLEDARELAYRSLVLRQAVGAAPAVAAQQLMVVQLELALGAGSRALRSMVDAAAETARSLDLPSIAQGAATIGAALTAAV